MVFKKTEKFNRLKSLTEVITTNNGEVLSYRAGTTAFMVDGKRYSFDDIKAFNEDFNVDEQYLVRTNSYIFLHIYTQSGAFAMNLSKRHDAGYDTAVALRNAIVAHREKLFQHALKNNQEVDFPILNSDFTIRVQSGKEMQLFDTETEVSETVQGISLKNRWFDVKTAAGESRFRVEDVCDLALLITFPDFIEKNNAKAHKERRLYWFTSLFLYAALLNSLLDIYSPPKNVIMLVFMAINLWAIFHIYGQIVHYILRPLMNRLNNWMKKN